MGSDRSNIGRREYIKYIGGTTAAGALAGCAGGGGGSGGGGSGGDGSGGGGSGGGDSGGGDSGGDGGSGGGDSGGDGGSGGGGNQPVSLTMSSFNEGTGWYVMAGALADAVSGELPSGSQISVRPFGGSIGCIQLLGQGDADLGLNHPVTARWATNGEYVFDQEYTGLRAILGHFDTYWVLVAAREEFGYTSFEQIREEQPAIRFGTGPQGGVSNTGVEQAFEAHGITFDEIEDWGGQIVRLGFGDMPSAMRNADIDMMGWVATPGHPTWTQISNDVDLRFMPFSDEAKQEMIDKAWMDMPDMPEGEFGATQPIPSVGWRTMLLTDTDLPDYVARTFAQTLIEDRESIASAYAAFSVFDPEKAGLEEFTAVPLHPGAEAYLSEQGYI